MQQTVIDRFIVPASAKEEFAKRLHLSLNFLKTIDGLIQTTAYEHNESNGELNVVTVAEWESEAALKNAREIVSSEYQRQGFDPAEMFKRLNIKIERGIYKRIEV